MERHLEICQLNAREIFSPTTTLRKWTFEKVYQAIRYYEEDVFFHAVRTIEILHRLVRNRWSNGNWYFKISLSLLKWYFTGFVYQRQISLETEIKNPLAFQNNHPALLTMKVHARDLFLNFEMIIRPWLMNCWSESEITVKKKTQNKLLTSTYLMVTIEPGEKFKKNKNPAREFSTRNIRNLRPQGWSTVQVPFDTSPTTHVQLE